ncbi:hypothetical protein [Mesorhizobium sp. M0146]|uniref:hypothetical protein n=1 Tax=unclassified Mesorhizobium TaxID=325217 RepID=UPI00333C5D39
MDKELIDWLEDASGLHTHVEMLYVVDGYRVTLSYDYEPIEEFHGETLREALAQAMLLWRAAQALPSHPLKRRST